MAQQCESHLLSIIWPLQSLLLHYSVVKARAVSAPPPVRQQGIVLTTEMVYSCWQPSKDFKQAFDLHGLVSLCQAHLVGFINCTITSKHLYTYRKLKLLPLQKVIMFLLSISNVLVINYIRLAKVKFFVLFLGAKVHFIVLDSIMNLIIQAIKVVHNSGVNWKWQMGSNILKHRYISSRCLCTNFFAAVKDASVPNLHIYKV